jgi:hypothetical protein
MLNLERPHMNERIKELMQQAGTDISGKWMSVDHAEKFAKLIAKECAGVCDLYAMPDGTSETAIILSAAIKRKFGVEE